MNYPMQPTQPMQQQYSQSYPQPNMPMQNMPQGYGQNPYQQALMQRMANMQQQFPQPYQQTYQPQYQQPQQQSGLQNLPCIFVSSMEEVRAALIDPLKPSIFASMVQDCFYTKQINSMGMPEIKTYKPVIEAPQIQEGQQIDKNKFDELMMFCQQLQQEIQMLKGGMQNGNVQQLGQQPQQFQPTNTNNEQYEQPTEPAAEPSTTSSRRK